MISRQNATLTYASTQTGLLAAILKVWAYDRY